MSDTIANETTYREAINQVRLQVANASPTKVHLYSFNIPAHELKDAFAALDKEKRRRAMRVTNSPDHNFIIKYMPGPAHEEAIQTWSCLLSAALLRLTTPPQLLTPGCRFIGSTTFELAEGIMKEPDNGIRPITSSSPTVILEVGDSESLTQLRIDAKLWLESEYMHGVTTFSESLFPNPGYKDLQVQLVIILSITRPNIAIELWRGFNPVNPPHSQAARQRIARMVWQADWTNNATPLHILMSDIFGGQVPPPQYGNNDRVDLDTVSWRQCILDTWNLP